MQVDEDFVLHAATEEGRMALLVYANTHAMDPSHTLPLPPPLETFVEKDNALFAAELAAQPLSPAKRKASSLSLPASPPGSPLAPGSPGSSMGVDRGSLVSSRAPSPVGEMVDEGLGEEMQDVRGSDEGVDEMKLVGEEEQKEERKSEKEEEAVTVNVREVEMEERGGGGFLMRGGAGR